MDGEAPAWETFSVLGGGADGRGGEDGPMALEVWMDGKELFRLQCDHCESFHVSAIWSTTMSLRPNPDCARGDGEAGTEKGNDVCEACINVSSSDSDSEQLGIDEGGSDPLA